MAWSYGRDGKRWQNMGKKCGKSWKDMLKWKKMIGKRYQWKWHIEIPKYDKMKTDAEICKAQTFFLAFFTSHQIWLSPIVGDHQPTYFTNLKKSTLAETSKNFTLKLIIGIL